MASTKPAAINQLNQAFWSTHTHAPSGANIIPIYMSADLNNPITFLAKTAAPVGPVGATGPIGVTNASFTGATGPAAPIEWILHVEKQNQLATLAIQPKPPQATAQALPDNVFGRQKQKIGLFTLGE